MTTRAGTPAEVRAYRLVKTRWAGSAFDGEGARQYGGRWNSPGKACVYVASSESLAILEVLVHLQRHHTLRSYTLFEITLNASQLARLDAAALPANWREDPAPPATARLGDAWLAAGTHLALIVPSTIVPRESNFVLNPAHPAFAGVVAGARELAFSPDPRLGP